LRLALSETGAKNEFFWFSFRDKNKHWLSQTKASDYQAPPAVEKKRLWEKPLRGSCFI